MGNMHEKASVHAVCRSETHGFSKTAVPVIHLIEGEGVEGDAHRGTTVKHRSRVKRTPTGQKAPNLRQVHLMQLELLSALQEQGFAVFPGALGENITTVGLDLLALPQGTRLQIGPTAVLEVTGLRNPCAQLDQFQPGLMAAVLDRDESGRLVRKAGVMAVVLKGGAVSVGDEIRVAWPAEPHFALECV